MTGNDWRTPQRCSCGLHAQRVRPRTMPNNSIILYTQNFLKLSSSSAVDGQLGL